MGQVPGPMELLESLDVTVYIFTRFACGPLPLVTCIPRVKAQL